MRKFKLMVFMLICYFLVWGLTFASNPFIWNLLWTQLEIWLNRRSSVWNIWWWNALSVHQESIQWNQYDLISELDNSKTESDRLVIIDNYIAILNNAVADWISLYDYEQAQVTYFNNAAKECEAPIKEKNSAFSDAIKSYNYEKAESIANEIAELRACIARNQVFAKAHASYSSAAKSLNSLQKKSDYLSNNKEKIAKYYEILKPDLLKELYDISKTVEANF